MITAVLHSSGTFMSGKMMISQKNCDVINAFNCTTMSFYGKEYLVYVYIPFTLGNLMLSSLLAKGF